jgi:hypothetical protein
MTYASMDYSYTMVHGCENLIVIILIYTCHLKKWSILKFVMIQWFNWIHNAKVSLVAAKWWRTIRSNYIFGRFLFYFKIKLLCFFRSFILTTILIYYLYEDESNRKRKKKWCYNFFRNWINELMWIAIFFLHINDIHSNDRVYRCNINLKFL